MKELIYKYVAKKVEATTLIRALSGAFDPEQAINNLTIINLVCRHDHGDIDTNTFLDVLGMS